MAGKSIDSSQRYDTYVGFILGTGTNTAYVEHNRNITKRQDLDPEKSQPINTESGNFSKCPRSPIDEEFDRLTKNRGQYKFEKMISGAYLGGLCLTSLKIAAEQKLFSREATQWLVSQKALSTVDLDVFLRDPTQGIFVNSKMTSAGDRMLALHLCSAIVERAAFLAAINIGAAIIKSKGGRSRERPVCVNVDGSTYTKIKDFSRLVEGYLGKILGPKHVFYELIRVDDSPLIGAAVAGLMG